MWNPKKRHQHQAIQLLESERERVKERGKKKKGSPLRETSAAHGAHMVFCLHGGEERYFAEAASLTTMKRFHAMG
jgi:hypothetical protein